MATAGPVHRVQSAVEVYGYPQGHMGHLTATEEAALQRFKTLLIEKGLYSPKIDNEEYGTHDDATLLYANIYEAPFIGEQSNKSDDSFGLAVSTSKMRSNNSKKQKTGATQINWTCCTRQLT
jgi:hypothetical protein